jgi:hypothetical protein
VFFFLCFRFALHGTSSRRSPPTLPRLDNDGQLSSFNDNYRFPSTSTRSTSTECVFKENKRFFTALQAFYSFFFAESAEKNDLRLNRILEFCGKPAAATHSPQCK